ncbi:hypothetical protein DT451_000875 [Escherichia coli]|nr:hypothetical protein [Escherichia coli]
MHPTQRKLMKRIILFLSLQFPITYPAIAGQDIDLVANVKNSTCKSGISNQGYNNRRLLGRLGHTPPAEAEKAYYASIGNDDLAA